MTHFGNRSIFSEHFKVCTMGVCSPSSVVTDSCVFSDNMVYQEYTAVKMTSPRMTCKQVFELASASNMAVSGLCMESYFQESCCQSCKSISTIFFDFINKNNSFPFFMNRIYCADVFRFIGQLPCICSNVF
jgi:hypothetical protein